MKMEQIDCQSVPAASTGKFGAVPTRLIRLPEVMQRVGLSRSAIYKRMTDGEFPRSRSLGPKCAVWIEAEIDAWIVKIAEI